MKKNKLFGNFLSKRYKIPNISFEVTALCNLKCRYCYNHWKKDDEHTENFNSYTTALKTLKRLFKIADVNHITFTGGEPLMAERFAELVLYVRMKRKTVTVISNGTFATPIAYKQLINLGVGLFELPIHSVNSHSHDYMANKSGSWKKSIETTQYLLQNNARVVSVVVLTKANCNEIAETLEFINSLGITRVMLNRFNIGGIGIKEVKNLMPSLQELKTAYRKAAEQAQKLKLSISSNVCTPVCVLNPKDYRGIQFTSCSFDIARRPITLDINGNIRFCNHSPVNLGNIHEKTLREIVCSPAAKQWQEIIPDFCSQCKDYSKCKAGCRAASEQLGLTLATPDPIIDILKIPKPD